MILPTFGGSPPFSGAKVPQPVLLNGKTVASAKAGIAVFWEIFKRIHTKNLLIQLKSVCKQNPFKMIDFVLEYDRSVTVHRIAD